MTDKDIYAKMLSGCTVRLRHNRNKRYSHCLYSGSSPVYQITHDAFSRINPLLKEKKGIYTLNLTRVRGLNGHHTCKILYKQFKALNHERN